MGYVFDYRDAIAYNRWYDNRRHGREAELESRLMVEMLRPLQGESAIDIGCGTGASLTPLVEAGLKTTGIDPSPYMLDIAKENLKHHVDFHRGFAEDLPFDDNSFNYACLVTTLEFVNQPRKALEEACRVAKDQIFIGVLNRYAVKGIQRRVKGIFSKTIYNHAEFFSVWEVKQIINDICGRVPISWRTVCLFPALPIRLIHRLEQYRLLQKCPFGAFVGMMVTLVPRFNTRPLPLRYRSKHSTDALT